MLHSLQTFGKKLPAMSNEMAGVAQASINRCRKEVKTMPHDQQQKDSRNDKSGKDQQKDMPKKGAGQQAQKGQTEHQNKDEARRMEQNR